MATGTRTKTKWTKMSLEEDTQTKCDYENDPFSEKDIKEPAKKEREEEVNEKEKKTIKREQVVTGTRNKTKWTKMSLKEDILPKCDYENYPFTKKEIQEPTMKERKEEVSEKEKKIIQREQVVTGTRKKTKWTKISLKGYTLPTCDFENHPFTKQMEKEIQELTMKEREKEVDQKVKEIIQREKNVLEREKMCQEFEKIEFGPIGRGRGRAKAMRERRFQVCQAPGGCQEKTAK